MEGLAFGLGMLLAVAGPLLVIPVVWLVYRLLAKPVVYAVLVPPLAGRTARWTALAVSLVCAAVVLTLSYLPGKWEFDQLCSVHAAPTVSGRVSVAGFYRQHMFPYEATRYLDEGGFTFVEAPHPYEKGIYVRYSKTGEGETGEHKISALESRYGVRKTLSELSHGILLSEKRVYEMASDRELARAAHLTYEGGPLKLFLGAYGMSSCPDISTEAGAQDFNTFYNLESVVLHAAD